MLVTLRYAFILAAGVSFGIVVATGVVNGVALLGLIFLAVAGALSPFVRQFVKSLIGDAPVDEPSRLDRLDGDHRPSR